MLELADNGWLRPTPAWLAAWLARPELALLPESCRHEIALHEALAADPLRPVSAQELGRLKDADARENYGHFLALRDGLLRAGTLEGWLRALWRGGNIRTPPLFIDAVVQTVLRGLLDNADAFELRAAESCSARNVSARTKAGCWPATWPRWTCRKRPTVLANWVGCWRRPRSR